MVSLGRGGLWGLGSRGQCCASVTHPHQNAVILIDRQAFSVDEFVLKRLEVSLFQCKSALQGAVREPLLALQKRQHLCQDVVKCHGSLSLRPGPGFDSAYYHAYNTTLAREGSSL